MINEPKIRPRRQWAPEPGAMKEDREMVPGLRLQILINRTDNVGMQVAVDIKLGHGEPFDRISSTLRASLHDDMDRLMNDVNRIWNKSFRGRTEIMKDLEENYPFAAALMKATGGIPDTDSELQKKLEEENRLPDGNKLDFEDKD